jgi:hypothetical protein
VLAGGVLAGWVLAAGCAGLLQALPLAFRARCGDKACARPPAGTGAGGSSLPALRSVQKALTRLHEDLAGTAEANLYALQYLEQAPGGTADGGAAAEGPEAGGVAEPQRQPSAGHGPAAQGGEKEAPAAGRPKRRPAAAAKAGPAAAQRRRQRSAAV